MIRCRRHLLEWIKFKRLTIPSAGENVGQVRLLFTAGGNAERYSHSLRKAAWQFLRRLKTHLRHDPAVPLLRVYPRETKTCVRTKSIVQIFIGALFIISETW